MDIIRLQIYNVAGRYVDKPDLLVPGGANPPLIMTAGIQFPAGSGCKSARAQAEGMILVLFDQPLKVHKSLYHGSSMGRAQRNAAKPMQGVERCAEQGGLSAMRSSRLRLNQR